MAIPWLIGAGGALVGALVTAKLLDGDEKEQKCTVRPKKKKSRKKAKKLKKQAQRQCELALQAQLKREQGKR